MICLLFDFNNNLENKFMIQIITFYIGIIIFVFFIYAAITSFYEKEQKAAIKLILIAIVLTPIFILPYILNLDDVFAKFILVIFSISLLILIIPIKGKKYDIQLPITQIDERDIMFSRAELIPNEDRYNDYYKRNPENLKFDNRFRKNPGLLNVNSSKYNPVLFAIADAHFYTVESFKNRIDGKISEKKISIDKERISKFIKEYLVFSGARECGITKLEKYHLYSIKGRGETYGKPVKNNHKFAIAITVEMNKEMTDTAPFAPAITESSRQYSDAGKLAVQLAAFIRNIGYSAKAHIDGNYDVVCPLVAKDAGLGELGRMGILMTSDLGPRVRIAVVTTSLELEIDKPTNNNSLIDFCVQCKKCAVNCPSQAISFSDRENIDGVLRWKINQEACFTYWTKVGTDCSKCLQVCPYSHKDNFLHNIVRKGISNSSIFRKFALLGDDFLYGKKPKSKDFPKFMNI